MENFAAIELAGDQAVEFGNRMFSREVLKLKVNAAKLSLFLSAEGRVQAIFWALRKETGLLLLTPSSRANALFELIEKYHFAEPFQTKNLGEFTSSFRPVTGSTTEGSLEGSIFKGQWRNTLFEVDFSSSTKNNQKQEWLTHRIQNLIPEYGLDFSENTLVFDLGFEELCEQNKGCYIGQEVVERVRSRGGSSPKKIEAFEFDGLIEPEENILDSKNQIVGSLTKSQIEIENHFLSLGFLKRGTNANENLQTEKSKRSGRKKTG